MSSRISELAQWLATLDQNNIVAIDEGGLTLVIYSPDATWRERSTIDSDPTEASDHFDLGGVPIDDDETHSA